MQAVIVEQQLRSPLHKRELGSRYSIVIFPVVREFRGEPYVCLKSSQVIAWSGVSAAAAIVSLGNWSQLGITAFVSAEQFLPGRA